MDAPDTSNLFSKVLRARTKRKLTATRTLNNLTVPLALSSPRVYLTFLRSYSAIFSVFEEEFEKRRRVYPRLNAIYFRELLRTKAFARDIDFYRNRNTTTRKTRNNKDDDNGNVKLDFLPSVEAFICEMQQALARKPILIVAYSYALYLGLYVASPQIKVFIRNAFDLNGNGNNNIDGVGIWDFSNTIANRHGFRKRYNTAMDDFELQDSEKEEIIAHVLIVLESSNRIFQEIRSTEEYIMSLVFAFIRATGGAIVLAGVTWMFFEPFKWSILTMLGFET